jgi:hypothetical protein
MRRTNEKRNGKIMNDDQMETGELRERFKL